MSSMKKVDEAVTTLKDAIEELLVQHPEGLRNFEVAEELDLHSSQDGKQKDYLSWSLLGLLMREGRVAREGLLYRIPD